MFITLLGLNTKRMIRIMMTSEKNICKAVIMYGEVREEDGTVIM
jgi:hypothetical protein